MATIEKYLTKAGETRYMVRYRKPDHGQTKKRGYRTKRDAEAAAVLLEAGKLRGEYIAPTDGRVKVDDIARAWLARSRIQGEPWRFAVKPRGHPGGVAHARSSSEEGVAAAACEQAEVLWCGRCGRCRPGGVRA